MPSRRDFLKSLALLAVAGRWRPGHGGTPERALSGEGPYGGEEFTLAHRTFKDGFRLPAVTRRDPKVHDVLVVGGGLSGLAAAYALRDVDTVLLEKDRMPGGNAKSENWKGIEYSLGSAYLAKPAPEDPLARLYAELGIDKEWRETSESEERVWQDGKVIQGFYDRTPQLKSARARFQEMFASAYPDVPFRTGRSYTEAQFKHLDGMSFADFMSKGAPGGAFPPEVQALTRVYSLASFGTPATQISAWAGLNFYLSEFQTLCVLPGGNAWVARRLAQRFEAAGAGRIHTGQLVARVVSGRTDVEVVTIDSGGVVTSQKAKVVVFASPKNVAAKTIEGISADQRRAMRSIQTRSGLVANLKLSRPVLSGFYGGYNLENPTFADLAVAEWATGKASPQSVLTVYFPQTATDARWRLADDGLFPTIRRQSQGACEAVLSAHGLESNLIEEVRLARWGHGYTQPRPGDLSSGLFGAASAPLDRVMFAHQDSQGTPCIESSLGAALHAASLARKRMVG